jgi:hypothetical protein
MDREALYNVLDVVATISGCVYIGAKAGRLLIRKFIKQARRKK